MSDVASSISFNGMVFKRFFETFGCMFVHDPSLEVQRGLNNARIFRSQYDVTKIKKYPVILFNRSPVRRSAEFSQVGVHKRFVGLKNADFNWELFYGVWGTIEYNFLFVCIEQRDVEQFEVMFTSDRHIGQLKKFVCTYEFENSPQPIGPFEYELLWDNLGEFGYGREEHGFISLSGSFKLNGEHIVFLDELAKGIKYVNITGYTKGNKAKLFEIKLDLTTP